MEAGTIVVLSASDDRAAASAFAAATPDAVLLEWDELGEGNEWARLCGAIAGLDPRPPLSIVTFGPVARHLPHVARAQRAARKRVLEYVLVTPELPVVTDTWPDAPVAVYCEPTEEASLQSRLRGWVVLPTAELAQWRPAE